MFGLPQQSAVTHSSLDLFEGPPVLINFKGGRYEELQPLTGVDGPTLEFAIKTDRDVFIDLRNTELHLEVKITKANGDPIVAADNQVTFVNNALHSLFSNCDVSLNGELINSSNSLHAHKALLSTEWSHSVNCRSSFLACHGYTYEENPSTINQAYYNARFPDVNNPDKTLTLYGRLASEFFNVPNALIPKVELRLKLVKNSTNFCLINSKEEDYGIKFVKASLNIRRLFVADETYSAIERRLLKTPARYTFPEWEAKTFIMPANQNQIIKENIFSGKPIRTLAIAMNTNAQFTGTIDTNPFHFRKFNLQKVVISRDGETIVNLNTTNSGKLFYTTLKGLHFVHDSPGIRLSHYLNHYLMCFDLTSTLEANQEIHFPELTGGMLRLELYFSQANTEAIEVLILGETLPTVYIKSTGEVWKDG